MRRASLALALLLGLNAVLIAEPETPLPSPTPTPIVPAGAAPAAQPLTPAAFVAGAQAIVEGELALLDGGPLSEALAAAAAKGLAMRLMLDPAQRSTRLQGVALQAVSATVQVRWKPRAGKKQRRLLADGKALLHWGPGQEAQALEGPAELEKALQRFERQWVGAAEQLPEGQRLDDALKALPDPSVNDPHFIRRRDASGE